MGVASIVLDDGGSEDEAIAALLHDAAEDHGGRERLEDIRRRFGDAVARIVEDCTDSWDTPKPPVGRAQARLHRARATAARFQPARLGRGQGAQLVRHPPRSAQHRREGVGPIQRAGRRRGRVLRGRWCGRIAKPAAGASSTSSIGLCVESGGRWGTDRFGSEVRGSGTRDHGPDFGLRTTDYGQRAAP